jgi:hypothetical protein
MSEKRSLVKANIVALFRAFPGPVIFGSECTMKITQKACQIFWCIYFNTLRIFTFSIYKFSTVLKHIEATETEIFFSRL